MVLFYYIKVENNIRGEFMKKKKFFALILTLLMTLGFAFNVSATTPNANNLTLIITTRGMKHNIALKVS